MEIWLDTIDPTLIKKMLAITNITGITTNPSILAQTNEISFNKVIHGLLEIQDGSIAIQILADTTDLIIKQARQLVKQLGDRIIVKIPANYNGLCAIKTLNQEGIRTLATAIFVEQQVLLSELSNANYAALYWERIEQSYGSCLDTVSNMLQIINKNYFNTKLMVAGIKSPTQLNLAAKLGAHAITIPPIVISALITDNQHTNDSIEKFQKDFSNSPLKNDFKKTFSL